MWRELELGEVVTLQRGFDLTEDQRKPGNVPVVSSSGISGSHSVAKVKGPGVVTGRYGTLGKIYFIRDDFWPHNTTLFAKDFHGNDERYVYYLLNSLNLATHSAVSAVPGVNRNDLHRIPVLLPPLRTQRRIAEILGRLDDKIEVNRRINRTLDAMAQALYKHWFVDFGPFQDGEFVESEMGLVPKGWRVGTLGEIAKNEKTLVDPQKLDPQTPYIGLADMPQGSIALDTWGIAGDSFSTKCQIERGQILFGKLRPYFKKVGVAPVDGVCSTDILVVVPQQAEYFSMVLCLLTQQEFIDHTEAVSDGTRMPRVSWEMMAKYPMVLPDLVTACQFDGIVRPWLESITRNVVENRALATTRDYLLPRLLARDVEV